MELRPLGLGITPRFLFVLRPPRAGNYFFLFVPPFRHDREFEIEIHIVEIVP